MKFAPKLMIGLGNPDPEYQNTYHNVGYLFIDHLLKIATARDGVPPSKNLENGGGKKLKLKIIKPDVYMNESGKFAAKEVKKSGVKPEELLIVHDDSDIELGKYKLSFGRGAAGHHGVENVQAVLKTKDFWRLRIGIRPADEKIRQKAEKFVLRKISAADKEILERAFKEIAKTLKNQP
ncbi:MAG: aminoacyl-tRNA hydrolase [Patescibacteria group bacterium]